jgi:hypothetical protein
MHPDERPDQAPEAPTTPGPSIAPKGRQALTKIRRELSEEELASPAVQRLLVDELERIERENQQLLSFREKYFVSDKQVAILEERLKKSLAGEIVFGACLAVAGASLGYVPAVWSHQPTGYLALGFGVVVLAIGVAARIVQK